MNTSKFIASLFLIVLSFTLYGQDLNSELLIHYPFSEDYQDQSINAFHGTPINVEFTLDRFNEIDKVAYKGMASFELPGDHLKHNIIGILNKPST